MNGNVGGEVSYLIDGIEIKRCPMCFVPIERDAGCAQVILFESMLVVKNQEAQIIRNVYVSIKC
jgi:hypothetical protein